MVWSAEQDAVGDVGEADLGEPFVDVMRFCPGGGFVAAGPEAAAVADGEGEFLAFGEEAFFPADV